MKVVSKKLNWMLGVMILCFAICFVAIVFYRPHNSDNPELRDVLEEQRRANLAQIKAREAMILQAQEMVSYLKGRDSVLNNSINNNSYELKKIRDAKKFVDYSDYGSEQLQRAVADAARQYRTGRSGY